MKQMLTKSRGVRHANQSGSARWIVLSLVCFMAGAALCAFCLLRRHEAPVGTAGASASELSEATKKVLHRLDSTVEIRFYSLLDPAAADERLVGFSDRVERLIALYQQEGGAKIQFTKADAFTYAASAVADGIKPFNIDKGNGCFLGVSILANGQRESLAQLAPEWESALESDLTRGITKVLSISPKGRPAPVADAASMHEVREQLPNIDTISVEEGTKELRASALADFQKVALAMQAELQQAQQDYLKAQASGSDVDRQSALKRIKEIQVVQTAKLKQIALNSQEKISALQQIKKAAE
jgi:hypothetical protein